MEKHTQQTKLTPKIREGGTSQGNLPHQLCTSGSRVLHELWPFHLANPEPRQETK